MPEFKLEIPEESAEEHQAFIASLPQGEDAYTQAGCDPIFAQVLVKTVEEKNCAFVVRGSDPIQLWEKEQIYIPKPTWLHAKRSNIDHMKGTVPSRRFIHALGKKTIVNGEEKIVTTSIDDIPDEKGVRPPTKPLVEEMDMFITLEAIKPPDHTILPSSNDKEILHVANDVPLIDGKPILFKLNLEEKDPSGNGYSLYIQIPPDTNFQRATKIGMRDKDQVLCVVGRDHDLATYEPSTETIKSAGTQTGVPSMALEVVNTFSSGGRATMIRSWQALHPDQPTPPQSAVVQYGCATSYEGSICAAINYTFNSIHPTISYPIQHGAEIDNPGKPSDLNAPMLHAFKNSQGKVLIVLTRNEEEFARLAKARAGSYYLQVHPKWNMKYWASVIEKQLSVGYSINAETLLNYLAYKSGKEIPSSIEGQKAFIQSMFSQKVIINGLTFNPLDRIFTSPVHDMELWGPTIQKQLERFKILPIAERNLGGTLRPLALLTYYQHQFDVINIRCSGDTQHADDLKINYHLFEEDIVNEVLKNEKHIKTTFIHPEFNLTKWLPVFIEQLKLTIAGKMTDHVIDPNTRNAFCKYIEEYASKQPGFNEVKLAVLKINLKNDKYLLEQLNLIKSKKPLELPSEKIEENPTKFIKTNSGRSLLYGSEVSPPAPTSGKRHSAPSILGFFTHKHPETKEEMNPKKVPKKP